MKVFSVLFLCMCAVAHCTPTLGRLTTLARRLVFGPSDLKYSNPAIFDANQGEVNRDGYRRAFGFQGETLVEAYGKGFSKKELQDMGYL